MSVASVAKRSLSKSRAEARGASAAADKRQTLAGGGLSPASPRSHRSSLAVAPPGRTPATGRQQQKRGGSSDGGTAAASGTRQGQRRNSHWGGQSARGQTSPSRQLNSATGPKADPAHSIDFEQIVEFAASSPEAHGRLSQLLAEVDSEVTRILAARGVVPAEKAERPEKAGSTVNLAHFSEPLTPAAEGFRESSPASTPDVRPFRERMGETRKWDVMDRDLMKESLPQLEDLEGLLCDLEARIKPAGEEIPSARRRSSMPGATKVAPAEGCSGNMAVAGDPELRVELDDLELKKSSLQEEIHKLTKQKSELEGGISALKWCRGVNLVGTTNSNAPGRISPQPRAAMAGCFKQAPTASRDCVAGPGPRRIVTTAEVASPARAGSGMTRSGGRPSTVFLGATQCAPMGRQGSGTPLRASLVSVPGNVSPPTASRETPLRRSSISPGPRRNEGVYNAAMQTLPAPPVPQPQQYLSLVPPPVVSPLPTATAVAAAAVAQLPGVMSSGASVASDRCPTPPSYRNGCSLTMMPQPLQHHPPSAQQHPPQQQQQQQPQQLPQQPQQQQLPQHQPHLPQQHQSQPHQSHQHAQQQPLQQQQQQQHHQKQPKQHQQQVLSQSKQAPVRKRQQSADSKDRTPPRSPHHHASMTAAVYPPRVLVMPTTAALAAASQAVTPR
mmetsp:Transcript_55842/g.107758  ORF Transcript_55842/g.107758 Transcript_55842/m.107758 type:complete len:671 (+) Transcript_55842:30-2042(+)